MEKTIHVNKFTYKRKLPWEMFQKVVVFLTLFFLGVIAGVLISNLFQGTLFSAWNGWNDHFVSGLNSVTVNNQELLGYILYQKIKMFGILWLLSITVLGFPYIILFCTYKGFTIGFLFCCIMQEYGARAFLIFGAYYFPQCLLYIPVFLLAFIQCRDLNQKWSEGMAFRGSGKGKLIGGKVLIFIVLLIMLVIGCIIEAYVNPSVMKNVL